MSAHASAAADAALIRGAREGNQGAFEQLLEPLLPRLRSFALRMVAHPDDAEDVVQDALIRALTKLHTFREESTFSTWMFSIVTRGCLDHLRHRRRWRGDAQDRTRQDDDAPHDAVLATLQDPAFRYEAREHIAFCFSCVARSLSPEEAAAVLLREVFSFSNREAADICAISESVFRHRLAAGRREMQDTFESLCGLIAKTGVCYQCEGFRNATPEERRGTPLPVLPSLGDASFDGRVEAMRGAEIKGGGSEKLHDLLFRAIADVEARQRA